MRFNKNILLVGTGVLFLSVQFSCKRHKEDLSVNQKDLGVPLQGSQGLGAKKLPPDIEKLNAIQSEIATLTDAEIAIEETKYNASLKAKNLVEKLNNNTIDASERAYAKDVLIRLALLRIEKGKRSAKNDQLKN